MADPPHRGRPRDHLAVDPAVGGGQSALLPSEHSGILKADVRSAMTARWSERLPGNMRAVRSVRTRFHSACAWTPPPEPAFVRAPRRLADGDGTDCSIPVNASR